MTNINNLPDYAYDYRYIVARECEGELWFWGAYDGYMTAVFAAEDIHGVVVTNKQARG